MEKDTVTIHAYYRQHDVYEIRRSDWEWELDYRGGDADDTLQCFIARGVEPVNGNTTEFYLDVEK